jgi:enoyl-CoA hydratase
MTGELPITAELIVRREGVAGFLTLKRPRALHALRLEMCHAMADALLGWAADDVVKAVIIDHGSGRGLCSGGDIVVLRRSALGDDGVSGLRR